MVHAATRTVVYDRWYLNEIERRERPRSVSQPRPRGIDRREADPRRALVIAAKRRGQSLAALSRMLDRPSGYLSRFVRDGHPRSLSAQEHSTLAAFFGVDERALGVRLLWAPM